MVGFGLSELLFNLGIGAMLALAFYNLLLFFAYDDGSYLSLCFAQFFWGLEFGHPLFPVITDHELYPLLRYSFLLVGVSFSLQLARQYLQTADYSRWMDNMLRILIVLGLLLIVVLPFVAAREWWVKGFLLLVSLTVIATAVYTSWLKKPLSYSFLLAVLSFGFLVIAPALMSDLSTGFFDERRPYVNYMQGVGIALAILFMTLIKVYHTRQLRSEYALAKAADQSKGDFLNMMSHEMRTPLNVLVGINRLLQDSSSLEQQKDYLGKMDVAAKNLLAISSNVLDLSQLDSKPDKFTIKIRPLSLGKVFNEIKELFSIAAEQKDLRLIVELVPATNFPIILGDRERLLQVLYNLVDNAIKYTEAGEVSVKCDLLNNDGQHAILAFCVRDTGVGLSSAQQDKLFRPFYRANNQYAREQSGTGLGLSICHQLIKEMGGTLAVESAPNEGSNFYFTLRLSLDPDFDTEVVDISAQKHRQQLSLKGIRILLVDDDEMNRIVGAKLLRNRGAVVDVVENGLSAIHQAEQQVFDLVFMDISMPGLDGYETARRLRAQKVKPLTVIALTAHVSSEEKERCLAAGMDDYLAKPFQIEDMEWMVLHHVQKHREIL